MTKIKNWLPEQLEEIKVFWLTGASSSEVARKFSGYFDGRKITRNAIIGMAHRGNWGSRAKASAPPKPRVIKPATPKLWAPPVKAAAVRQPQKLTIRADDPDRQWVTGRKLGPVLVDEIAAAEPIATALVPLLEIKAGQCRWVAAEHSGNVFYCGAPVTQNGRGQASSWCKCHYRRVFTKETADQAMRRAAKQADRITMRTGQRFGRASL